MQIFTRNVLRSFQYSSFQISNSIILLAIFISLTCKLTPSIFDWINIRTPSRPWKDVDSHCMKILCCGPSSVDRGIILLKHKVLSTKSGALFEKAGFIKNLDIPRCIKLSIHDYEGKLAISRDGPPYHNASSGVLTL